MFGTGCLFRFGAGREGFLVWFQGGEEGISGVAVCFAFFVGEFRPFPGHHGGAWVFEEQFLVVAYEDPEECVPCFCPGAAFFVGHFEYVI